MKTRWVVVIGISVTLAAGAAGFMIAQTVGAVKKGLIIVSSNDDKSKRTADTLHAAFVGLGVDTTGLAPLTKEEAATSEELMNCKLGQFDGAVLELEAVVDNDSLAEGYVRFVQQGGYRRMALEAATKCDTAVSGTTANQRYATTVLVYAHASSRESVISALLPKM